MACASVSITSSPIATSSTKDVKNNGSLRRCQSSKDLYDRDRLRRSHSDPQLRCSLNPTQAASAAPAESKLKSSNSSGVFPFEFSSSMFPHSVRSFLFESDVDREVTTEERQEEESGDGDGEDREMEELEKRANWVGRLLELRSRWMDRHQKEQHSDAYGEDGGCEVDYSSEDEEEASFDRETFSKLLVRVSWSDTKLFSKLAFLCNMAYVIPEIKEEDLRKYYDLQFVTSSLEKKAEAAMKMKQDHDLARISNKSASIEKGSDKTTDSDHMKRPIRSSAAYEIAASAASYIQSSAKGLLALANRSQPENYKKEQLCKGDNDPPDDAGAPLRMYKSEVAAYMAASTMTAVVAAEEAAKQQAAKDLQSLHSSPCEWFVVDDPSTCTRCFVTQGSDSLASWQANLFFEPTKFECTEVFVHRGIYEAAKGIYEQFMPEIQNHLGKYGERAKLRFIGHSLGGSLSLLVHLMLLARGAVKASTLLPVVTFGSPFIFCGGRRILDELGWEENKILSVMMHRDIVPRAFSCNYPNHVTQILKRLNGSFRSHPCLNSKKMLYTPLGQLFILQPDEKSSPPHPLLPPGGALYALDMNQQLGSGCCGGVSSALRAFLNTPHPLETLSDPTAYGSEGTILRDHDSSNYLKATNVVLRKSTKIVVRWSKRERLFNLWPVLTTSQLTQQLPRPWSLQQKLEDRELIGKEVVSGA